MHEEPSKTKPSLHAEHSVVEHVEHPAVHCVLEHPDAHSKTNKKVHILTTSIFLCLDPHLCYVCFHLADILHKTNCFFFGNFEHLDLIFLIAFSRNAH